MSYKIIGKYIQDLNFRIPNPKTFFLLSKDISNYKISVDIKSNQIKENIIEVLTSLSLKPNNNELDKINTKIVFATIVELSNDKIEKDKLEQIVLVDVPSQIYGELRRIFVNLFENSGFKDIRISEKLDFKKLYDLKKTQ
jgi:preprotein translocase subunit SecB